MSSVHLSVCGQLRIKNRLLVKKEKTDKEEQQDQCQEKNNKTSVRPVCRTQIYITQVKQVYILVLVCCVNTSKIQFIPMIDRKSHQCSKRSKGCGIDMLSVFDSAKAVPPFKLACKGCRESHVKDIMEVGIDTVSVSDSAKKTPSLS